MDRIEVIDLGKRSTCNGCKQRFCRCEERMKGQWESNGRHLYVTYVELEELKKNQRKVTLEKIY